MKKLFVLICALSIGWTSYSVNDKGELKIVTLDETKTTIENELNKMGISGTPYFKTGETPSREDRDYWVMDSKGNITVDEAKKSEAEADKAQEELKKPEAQIEVLKQENEDLRKRIEELEYDVLSVKEDVARGVVEKNV